MADTTTQQSVRMSGMDAMLWAIEQDPAFRSTMMMLTVFDRELDRDQFMDRIERSARLFHRFRQVVVAPPFGVAPPRWVVDTNFDLAYHLRFLRAAGEGTLRDVLDMAAPIAMSGFDRARPLWEYYVIDGMSEGRSALLQKVHHSIVDGVGGADLYAQMFDLERHPELDLGPLPDPPASETVTKRGLFAEGVAHQAKQVGRLAARRRGSAERVVDPASWRAKASSLRRIVTPDWEPMSPVLTGRSLSVRFDTITLPLAPLKKAANNRGCRLNDAFVAAAAGALARYHRALGVEPVPLKMVMPINVRPDDPDELTGNQFVPVRMVIPADEPDPAKRMTATRDIVAQWRREPGLSWFGPFSNVVSKMAMAFNAPLPRGYDFGTSNVAGPPIPLYLAGAKVEANIPLGPTDGCAATMVLLSYLMEHAVIGITTDPAAIADTVLFRQCVIDAFEEVAATG